MPNLRICSALLSQRLAICLFLPGMVLALARRLVRRLLFTEHALDAIERRQMSVSLVRMVARAPEQVVPLRPGRVVAQAICEMDQPSQVYLVRVVIDVRDDRAEVVTAYRTTRIARYWRGVS